jgi:asparagine synthase (glutamine-hydrolysing)
MANSLEVRSPFMDHRIAEFAASLPFSFKQHGTSRKHILKETFKDLLPDETANRGKMGFGVPVAAWFRGKWDKPLRERLLEGISVKDGFFNKPAVEEMIKTHQTMKADHSYPLWTMLIFEMFLEYNRESQ